MKRISMLIFFLALAGAPMMRADTIFFANGLFQSGAVLSGTITLNTVSGVADSADVFLTAPDANEFQFIQSQYTPTPGVTILQLGTMAMGIPQLILAFPLNDFTGYTGGVICAPGGPCGGSSNLYFGTGIDEMVSGSLTTETTAAVPEPSPAWELGIGLVALALGFWRGQNSKNRSLAVAAQYENVK